VVPLTRYRAIKERMPEMLQRSRALAMRVCRIRFTIRSLFIAIAIGAIPMAFFRPGSRVEVQSVEQAVEVAAALAMQEDATFRPDKHRAKVYRECGMVPLRVDFYSSVGTYVVKRIMITDQGVIQGPWAFTESDQVKSARNGPGMYLLNGKGKVIALLPYIFGPDGEVAGVSSMPPITPPSP
jgi:hypothetical protein